MSAIHPSEPFEFAGGFDCGRPDADLRGSIMEAGDPPTFASRDEPDYLLERRAKG
jgi:hypothetical protein